MHKHLLRIPVLVVAFCAVLSLLQSASALGIPQREVLEIAVNSTTTSTVPHFANGQVLSVQLLSSATNGVTITDATAEVKHVLRAGTTTLISNTLLAAATNAVIYSGSTLPVAYPIPGDLFTVKLSNTNATGKVAIVIGGGL